MACGIWTTRVANNIPESVKSTKIRVLGYPGTRYLWDWGMDMEVGVGCVRGI